MSKRYPRTVLASAVIPWTETFEFDEAIFRRQVKGMTQKGIHHLYVFGTAGEGYAVSDGQYEQIITAFADEMRAPGLHPMAGIISLSFSTMLARVKTAYNLGIRDFMITLPSWGALSDEEMNRFFHDICDPFPDCRFVIYNLMRTKRLLSVAELNGLADQIPNLAGVKYSTNDVCVMREIATAKSDLQFFVTETGLSVGNLLGECSLLLSIGNINIKRALEYFDAAVSGDLVTSMNLFKEMMMIHKALMYYCKDVKIDGAYDKLFSRIVDPEFPIRLLPPYIGFTEEVCDNFRIYVKENYPAWLEPQARVY